MQPQPVSEKELAPEKNGHRAPEPSREPFLQPKQKGQKKYWVIALVAAGVLGSAAIGSVAMRKAAPKVDIAKLTVPVESKNLTVRIAASGIVRPVQTVNLSPKTQGRLAELYVEQGDRVQEGQIVARMESAEIEAQLMQAQARLASAKARLAKQQAGSRPEEIAQARARLSQAEARLAQLRAGSRVEEIAQAQARVEQARTNLADAESGTLLDEIAQAQAQVESAKASAQLMSDRVRRYQELTQQGAIAEYTFEEYKKEERSAIASLQETQRRLDRARENRRAEIARRRAALEVEQQALQQLENGTRKEELARGEAEVAEAQSNLEQVQNGTRKEDIAQAAAEVAEAEAQVRYNEVQLEDAKIRAPFAGIITQRYATEGAFVTPATSASDASSATSTSIVALARDVEVLAKVPEADISQIKAGQGVEIVADAYPDKVFKGRVRLVAPEAVKERDVTLFQVRVEIETGKDELQSGMNVDLRFLGAQVNNALVVPPGVIVTDKCNGGQKGVLIPDENNKAKFKPITVGSTIDNEIQVLEGLKPGDRVFEEPPPGQKIEDIITACK